MMSASGKSPRLKRPLSDERKAEAARAGYSTGFAVPPATTRFEKGHSGNPKGRPKAARALKTDVAEVLDIEVTVSLPSGPQPMRMQQAMVMSLAAKAAKGDVRAAQAIIRLIELTLPERLHESAGEPRLDPAEQAEIERLLNELGLPPPEPGGRVHTAAAAHSHEVVDAPSGNDAAEDDWNIV